MKWTGLNDLRESYLKFFESKGHLRMASAPLVPQGDNSVLLINAGMTPLKKYFQGIEEPPRHRVTTCQKCIRTPDIDNVGKTARHGTYFEMLGNFSFGDYFKHEATAWAWEYLTKVLEIPEDRLWVTIYEKDDEAGDIWANEVGVPRDRIIKLGKADNFWEHGSGPCGPCSEIHFDRGEKYGPFESFEQAGECDRIIEIWNLVFTQFDNDGKGNYTQLATKYIDTGMGLERLACVMQVIDTKKTGAGQFICNCHVESGCFYTDDSVKSAVDEKKRMATARNHTCAHLLQAALRKVLGDHVHQAGSFVDPYRCRFDFSHFSAVTPEELEKIEMLVNDWILAGIPVVTEELPIEEARKKGAMALFGEKYGDIVRVVQAGDVSTEFCGGTHLDNTAKAGLFKIISETSVASGVRRIEAVTGYNVLSAYDQTKAMVTNIAQVLKIANPSAVMQKCENMMNEMHAMQAEIDRLNGIISMSQMKNVTEGATEVNGIKVFSAMLSGVTGDSLRKAGDKLKDANDSFIAVLAGVSDGKGNFLCIASPEAVAKGANAGKIVKEIAAIAGGKGGGKPDTAMAGIADVTKIDEALLALTDIVKNMIG